MQKISKYFATVDKVIFDANNYDTQRVLLVNIICDDKRLFRDHLWITPRKKDMFKCEAGDKISFFATEYKYIDVDTGKNTKKGLKHIRRIEKA